MLWDSGGASGSGGCFAGCELARAFGVWRRAEQERLSKSPPVGLLFVGSVKVGVYMPCCCPSAVSGIENCCLPLCPGSVVVCLRDHMLLLLRRLPETVPRRAVFGMHLPSACLHPA